MNGIELEWAQAHGPIRAKSPHTCIHFDGSPQVLPLFPQLCQPVPQGLFPLQQLFLFGL